MYFCQPFGAMYFPAKLTFGFSPLVVLVMNTEARTGEVAELRRQLERSEKSHALERAKLKSELRKMQAQLSQEMQAKQHLLSQSSTPAIPEEDETFTFSNSSSLRVRLQKRGESGGHVTGVKTGQERLARDRRGDGENGQSISPLTIGLHLRCTVE